MRDNYGWYECRIDLEEGVNPITVAERMGEPVDFIREVLGNGSRGRRDCTRDNAPSVAVAARGCLVAAMSEGCGATRRENRGARSAQ